MDDELVVVVFIVGMVIVGGGSRVWWCLKAYLIVVCFAFLICVELSEMKCVSADVCGGDDVGLYFLDVCVTSLVVIFGQYIIERFFGRRDVGFVLGFLFLFWFGVVFVVEFVEEVVVVEMIGKNV